MPDKNTNFNVIRLVLMLLVDAIEAERRQNAIQDHQLSDHDNRISALEKLEDILNKIDKFQIMCIKHETQIRECQHSVNFLEAEIPHLRNLVGLNEDLQNRVDFYCPLN